MSCLLEIKMPGKKKCSVKKSCRITDGGSTRHTLPEKYAQTQRSLLSSQQRMASNRRRSLGCMFEGMGSAQLAHNSLSRNKSTTRKKICKQDMKMRQIVAGGVPFGQLYPSSATTGTGMTGSVCVRGSGINWFWKKLFLKENREEMERYRSHPYSENREPS